RHPPRLAAALLARTAARRAPVALHRPVAHQRALRDHRRVGGYPRRPLRPPPAATGDHPQRHPLSLVARYLMPKVIREKGYQISPRATDQAEIDAGGSAGGERSLTLESCWCMLWVLRWVAQLGRAAVSKTAGCRFDSCPTCPE